MPGLTVSTNSSGVVLTNTASNPVTIDAGVYVGNASTYALGSQIAYNWTIDNAGTLGSSGTGSLSDGILLQLNGAAATTPDGVITNASSGRIDGYYAGVVVQGTGTLLNQGVIVNNAVNGVGYSYTAGTGFVGLEGGVLMGGGAVTNAAGGTISSYFEGVVVGDGGRVLNAGYIQATSPGYGFGVVLSDGGAVTNVSGAVVSAGDIGVLSFLAPATVTNAAGATIYGGRDGIYAASSSVLTLNNSGVVAGSIVAGVFAYAGGMVTNASGGTIASGKFGLFSDGSLTLTNAGVIAGTYSVGVVVRAAASITNAAAGHISGYYDGIYAGNVNAISITNDGSVIGTGVTGSSGVFLTTGGYFNNAAGALVESPAAGVRIGRFTTNASGSIVNHGTIIGGSGFTGAGIYLFGSSSVSNASTGQILGGDNGLYAGGTAASTLTNRGAIVGYGGSGAAFGDGGSVTNASGGTIGGYYFGVSVRGASGTMLNAGSIDSTATAAAAGVQVRAGGYVSNASSGVITGHYVGVEFGNVTPHTIAGGTLVNQGRIYASNGSNVGAGVWISGSGSIINEASGTISGGPFGIVAYEQVTVDNFGTIIGGDYGFKAAAAGYADRIIDNPGALIVGTITGGSTVGSAIYSTFELASGASHGTISGFGSTIVDFGRVLVDAGADWSLGGSIALGQFVSFGGADATLTFLNPGTVDGTIGGFTASDTIVLAGITNTSSLVFNGDTLVVNQSTGAPIDLVFTAPKNLTFSVTGGATDITVACFAAGTRIQTDTGPVAVERLRVGMSVESVFGGLRAVTWIGHRAIDCTKHPRPVVVWPIEISAGAFGPGLPVADLRLSPEHAVYVNDVLIPVRFLVNGTTVRQIPVDHVVYYHVEVPTHDVLLAEGLPAESYLSFDERANFDDASPMRLFPDFATPPADLAEVWEAQGCAPLVVHGPQLDAVRAMLQQQSCEILIARRLAA